VTGLLSNRLYHFKLVAKNASGPIEGEDETFTPTTPPLPPVTTRVPTATTATPPSVTPTPVIAPIAPIEPTSGSPLTGSPSLSSSQHGNAVRGSVQVSQAGAGGRLEVDLLASGASLAKAGHSAQTRIGQLLRSSLKAGSVPFSVPLTAKARSALRRHRRLALTVRIVLTSVHGAAVTVTKHVVLHA
jgi:hypothetical protein